MIPYYKTQTNMQLYWITSIILVLLFAKYGSDAIRFFLTKLYEFFIQKGAVGI